MMNEQNMDQVLQRYASATQNNKEQDLRKFQTAANEPHHSTAPMKRRIICISLCVFLLAAFCISTYLASRPNFPLWDLEVTKFADFQAGKWNVPADQTQTFAECIAQNQPTAAVMKGSLLPTLPCREITANWLHRIESKTSPVGIYGKLIPSSGPVAKLGIIYLWKTVESNQEILREHGYADLPNTTQWQGLDLSYSKSLTPEDGTVYKIRFETNNQFCVADIYTDSDATLTELLEAVFA